MKVQRSLSQTYVARISGRIYNVLIKEETNEDEFDIEIVYREEGNYGVWSKPMPWNSEWLWTRKEAFELGHIQHWTKHFNVKTLGDAS